MFAGAVLNAICDGKTLDQSAKFGCFAASEKVKKSGPRVETGQYNIIKEDFYT